MKIRNSFALGNKKHENVVLYGTDMACSSFVPPFIDDDDDDDDSGLLR